MKLKDVSKILNYDKKKKFAKQSSELSKEGSILNNDFVQFEKQKGSKYIVYLTIFTFIFFLISVFIAFFIQSAGIDRSISTNKITLITQGPSVTNGGETIPLKIIIINRNPVPILSTRLIVTYPDGTYVKDDGIIKKNRQTEFELGTLEKGDIVNKTINPILYGLSNEIKKIKYELSYRVDGSSQPTRIINEYDILLRNSQILLSEPKYSNPIAGKEFTFSIQFQSIALENTSKIFVKVTYPRGFNIFGMIPKSNDTSGNIWSFNTIKPNEIKNIQVSGILRGEEKSEHAINVEILISPTGELKDATTIAKESSTLSIGKAFIDLELLVNGKREEQIFVSPGDKVRAQINWRNEDTSQLRNIVIYAKLSGTGLDQSNIDSGKGHYDEIKKEIIWDKQLISALKNANVGKKGQITFSFRALPNRIEFAQSRKNIIVTLSVEAERISINSLDILQDIEVAEIGLRSVLQVVGNVLYNTSSIQNFGPLPPRPENQTSYVIRYSIKNSGNELKDFKINIPVTKDATLTGQTSGLLANELSFDESENIAKINIKNIAAIGSGSNRTIELQVVVNPQLRDVGKRLTLVKKMSYSTIDTYTGERIEGELNKLTTELTTESTHNSSFIVTK